MENIDKIVEDHQNKSAKLRTLKKKMKNKMKNRIPLSKIQELLEMEQKRKVNPTDFADWDRMDNEAYGAAVASREARIELLKEILTH